MKMHKLCPMNLSGTPIWEFVCRYYDLSTVCSEEIAQEWLYSEYVPEQLRPQIKLLGDRLIEQDIDPSN